MSSIALPALHVQAPESPVDQYSKVLSLKSLLQNQKMQAGQQELQQQQIQSGQMQNQQQQQQMRDQQTVMQTLQATGGDFDKALPQLAGKVSPQTYMALQKNHLETRKTLSEISDKELIVQKDKNERLSGLTQQVQAMPDDQYAQQWPQIVNAALQIDPKLKLDPNQVVPKAQIGQLSMGLMTSEQYIKQEADKRAAAKSAAELPGIVANSQKDVKVNAGTNEKGVTADQQATLNQGERRIQSEAAARAETHRHNLASEGSLTPEALTMAASQFAATGKMPELGRNAAIRAQIINEAARVNPSLDLASNSAAYKANAESLKKLQTGFDQVTAFENTAGKNLDVFLDTAKKVIDTGSPFLNTPVRLVTGKMGGTDQVAFDAARTTALTEIAKVLNSSNASGVLSDSARHEVEGLIGKDATLKQIVSAANILKTDMANRHEAYQDQIGAIKKRIPNVGKDSGGGSGGGFSVTDPNGKVHPFKTQAEADAFKKMIGQ